MYMGAEASAPTVEAARSGRPAVSGACLARREAPPHAPAAPRRTTDADARPCASWGLSGTPQRFLGAWSTALPRAGRRASPWRVFKGVATYQRTPISPMSGGPCAPWTVPARRLLPR